MLESNGIVNKARVEEETIVHEMKDSDNPASMLYDIILIHYEDICDYYKCSFIELNSDDILEWIEENYNIIGLRYINYMSCPYSFGLLKYESAHIFDVFCDFKSNNESEIEEAIELAFEEAREIARNDAIADGIKDTDQRIEYVDAWYEGNYNRDDIEYNFLMDNAEDFGQDICNTIENDSEKSLSELLSNATDVLNNIHEIHELKKKMLTLMAA